MKLTIDLEQLADFLSQALGDRTEVAIHDLTDVAHSLQIIRNGHISNRKIGAPATDLTLKMVRACQQAKCAPFLTNYTGKTADGRALRSSSMALLSDEGEPVALLCLNSDDSHFLAAVRAVQSLVPACDHDMHGDENEELFSNSIEHVGEQVLAKVLANSPVPLAKMSADEKKELAQKLDQAGVFLIKGFVARAAQLLDISEPTLYRYLKG